MLKPSTDASLPQLTYDGLRTYVGLFLSGVDTEQPQENLDVNSQIENRISKSNASMFSTDPVIHIQLASQTHTVPHTHTQKRRNRRGQRNSGQSGK